MKRLAVVLGASLALGGLARGSAGDATCTLVGEDARSVRKGLGEAGKAVRLGLVADPKEALPATLANLERFAGVFHRERVAAVLLLGDLGSSEEEIARVILALKAAEVPILVLAGEREPESAFHAAVARARKGGADVIDLGQKRALAGDGVGLVSLPGYSGSQYGTGCHYGRDDVDALAPLDAWLAETATGRPLLFVAHAPPRGVGPQAIDWGLGGANDGDPALARLLPSLHAHIGAFAHVDEAGGRASDGQAPVAEGAWSERLYLNVGAADAVPHALSSGGTSRGQAMLLELADGKARVKVVR